MIKGGKGGGNTRTGLVFEGKTDLSIFLNNQPHYNVIGCDVFYDDQKVAEVYKKHKFYDVFLRRLGIDWTKYISNNCCRTIAFLFYLTILFLLLNVSTNK